MKKYLYEGAIWFFEEGKQPKSAVEVESVSPKNNPVRPPEKAARPDNKSRKVANK